MKPTLRSVICAFAVLVSLPDPSASGAAQPPAGDLKLWLKADTGLTTNSDGTVTAWADQADGVKHGGVSAGDGIPVRVMNPSFPGGPRPAVHFDGTTAVVLTNRDDLQIPSLSVYVVASVDNTVTSGIFIADMRDPYGFALGVSDSTAGRARWYTGAPADNMQPAAADLANGMPYLVEGTFAGGAKKLFLNGVQAGSATGKSLSFATWSALAVGCQGVYPAEGELETGEPAVLSKFLVGDISEILVYASVSDAQRLAVEAYIYQKYFSQSSGSVVIAKQPLSQKVNELGAVTLSVNADGAPPLSYQWLKNGQNVSGANGPFCTLTNLSRTDAGVYSVKVSNAAGSVTSDEAVLTVIPDTTSPTLLAADRDFLDATRVTIVFSKPVASATATVAANYAINNGILVTKAAMGATPDTVQLTTSAITYGPAYSVTVSAVQDLVGNVIVANVQRRVTVPDPNAAVPTANLKLWLRADVDVKVNASGAVTAWADRQVGSPAKNGTAVGTPVLSQAEYFSSGTHPVITFDGSSGFNLANVADMRLTNMTFYMVSSVATLNMMRVMLGNYRDVAGWCIGVSDSISGRLKWFTAPPNSMEPEGGQLAENTPVLLTASYTSVGGVKKLYVNRALAGSASGVNLSYATDTQLTVGYLQGNRQYLVGDIAEILAYSSVSDSQRSLVEAYLYRKYFSKGTGPVSIILQPASQTINELQAVTFEVIFEGAAPIGIQWLRNGAPISGATNSVYVISSASRTDNQAQYSARLNNALGTVVSSNAVLTVVLDTVPPALSSAKRDYLEDTQVVVVFSKALTPATATQAANYRFGNGITTSRAEMGPNANTVILTTSHIAAGQTVDLTVNGVQDLVGNAIATNAQIRVQLPASSVRPPANQRMLWLAADAGVSTSDGSSVTSWSDQAGGSAPHHGSTVVGSPQRVLADFPNGRNLAIRFDGASGFILDNPRDLDLQDYSISIVASVNNTVASEMFIANWPGMGFGISDATPGTVKWVSYDPTDSLEPAGAALDNQAPYVLTGTFQAGVVKKLYVNTVEVGSTPDLSISYADAPLVVGMIGENGSQYLQGDIAEILVYSAVSDAQRGTVEDYLRQKYFLGGAVATPALSISRSQNNVVLAWPVSASGFGLQVADQLAPSAQWANEPASIVVSGAHNTVTVPIGSASRFYRLSR